MPPCFFFFFAELGRGVTFGEVLRVGAAGWGAERDHGPVPARAGRADTPPWVHRNLHLGVFAGGGLDPLHGGGATSSGVHGDVHRGALVVRGGGLWRGQYGVGRGSLECAMPPSSYGVGCASLECAIWGGEGVPGMCNAT